MDEEPDVIRQVAQVYVDLVSIAEDSLPDGLLAEALDLATQRAADLGAVAVRQDGETVTVDPTNLVAGGVRALLALTGIIEQHTALSREALLAEWREAIDDGPRRA